MQVFSMNKTLLFPLLLLTLTSAALAQRAYEPRKGSAEHTAILKSIRTYDAKRSAELANETLNVSALRVQGSWAYANIEQQPRSGDFYGQAHVFLQKINGRWKVAFSTYNESNEVGVDGLARLRKKNRSFPKALADFAMRHMAG